MAQHENPAPPQRYDQPSAAWNLLGIRRTLSTYICTLCCHLFRATYIHVLLLSIWRLRSFSKHLDSLTVAVEQTAAHNVSFHTNSTASAYPWDTSGGVHNAWHAYLRFLEKDLELWASVCGQILMLTIGLLAVASIVQDNPSQTLAFACIFTSGTGAAMSMNMKRHINHIRHNQNARVDWIRLAERYSRSQFVAVPLLLAATSAWSAWSTILFIALLLSYVCAAGKLGTRLSMSTASSTIISLTWPSITILSILLIIVLIHTAVHAYYFTKLGTPLTAEDTETANSRSTSTLPTRMSSCSRTFVSIPESLTLPMQYAHSEIQKVHAGVNASSNSTQWCSDVFYQEPSQITMCRDDPREAGSDPIDQV